VFRKRYLTTVFLACVSKVVPVIYLGHLRACRPISHARMLIIGAFLNCAILLRVYDMGRVIQSYTSHHGDRSLAADDDDDDDDEDGRIV